METDARNRSLLAIAAALAVIKFGLMPWIDVQNELRQNLEVLTRRLERSVAVVRNRAEILRAETVVNEAEKKNFARFPVFESLDAMKLVAQVKIGDLAKTKNLRLSLFEWVLVGEDKGTGLQFARARVQVSGELQKLAFFHGEVESFFPNMIVRDFRLESPPVNEFVEYGGSLTLVGDFYFKRQVDR